MSDVKRCAVCDWPLAASAAEGCVEGSCSQRPAPRCWICKKQKGQPPERCNGHYSTVQCPELIDGSRCIFLEYHGGDHYAPHDSQDHSDEIRIRVLRDNAKRREDQVRAFEDATRELLRQYDGEAESAAPNSVVSRPMWIALTKLRALLEAQ